MPVLTQRPTSPGRTGSLRSARKAMWLAIYRARGVLTDADDPTVILQACTALTAAVHEYVGVIRAIEHPDA